MFLNSNQIKKAVEEKEISITSFNPSNLKGASYTFTLDSRFKAIKKKDYLDSRVDPEFDEIEIGENGYELKQGDFAVFYTKEKVTLNGKYICILSTRATIAQMGLDVTQGSFLAEPDTDNQFALEITNRGPMPIKIYTGIKIVKGIFSKINL